VNELAEKTNWVGVVGPCSAGKTTLIGALKERGYPARHIAQEHSFVADMWQRLVNPWVLIYLDVSYQESMRRRPLEMSQAEFKEQDRRLSHAREHADFYFHTDGYSPQEVLGAVEEFLGSRRSRTSSTRRIGKLDKPIHQEYNAPVRQPLAGIYLIGGWIAV
jgi:guanylate kinase